jgi:hypothetical protein
MKYVMDGISKRLRHNVEDILLITKPIQSRRIQYIN